MGFSTFQVIALFILVLFCTLILIMAKRKRPKRKNSNQFSGNSHTPVRKLFCTVHSDIPAKGVCAICDEYRCSNCLEVHKTLNFCHEHFQLYRSANWQQAITLQTDSDNSELGPRLYQFKEGLWKEKMRPSFIQTHYRINIENDNIETFVSLYCQSADVEEIKGLYETLVDLG